MSGWDDPYETKPAARPITGVVVMKVDVSSVSSDEMVAYIESVRRKVTNPQLEAQGFVYYFIPTRDESTSMTFIDLQTMRSCRA